MAVRKAASKPDPQGKMPREMHRGRRGRIRSMDAVFRPKSVAVVGASRKRNTIGHEILRNLMEFGFEGPVYPVNPTARSVHSTRAYPRVTDIPGDVDLAIVTVPRNLVLKVIDQCGEKGVRGIVVITAGFKEVGGDGIPMEDAVRDRVAKHGMRLIGPNCMGVINTEPDVRLNATFAATVPERGNVGFISQSGALGEAILADAADSNLGVAMFVSMGNKTDVSGNDLMEYWADNPDIQVVLMYLESFGNPKRFTQLAREVTRKKPVITVKAGRTAAGARAASSHTGSIVELDVATESLLEQCGVMRVSSMDEMFVKASALASQPIPEGDRIAIITNAGGPGILATDTLIGRGLTLAELQPSTRRALSKALAPEASTVNPVDMIASADADRYRATLEIVRKDPGVDGIIAIFVSPIMIDAYEVARAIAECADGSKPVLSVFMGKRRSEEGTAWLRSHRVPVYRFPEDAAQAMSALCRYRTLRDAAPGKAVRFRVDRRRAARAIARCRRSKLLDLPPAEVHEVLAAYGLPLAPSRTVTTPAEAIEAAGEFGYPVVLKIASGRISHKSDVGGVRVDLRNADEVAASYRDLMSRLRRKDPDLRITVQKMIKGGREVILGMSRDPQFGPLVMFGLGGIFVEVMRDVSVRIHPLTDESARTMIERIKGYPLLAGARGEKAVDLDLLQECLLRLSQMIGDHEDDLAELDINPLIMTDDRASSFAVDARITLTERS